MYPADATTFEMTQFAIEGNIIDHSWPFIVTLENGKPDHTAIMLLAHIVYWYRPSYDPETKMPCKKYQGDLLQRSYPELERDLGLTKREAQEAFQRLEKLDFVHREFRTVERDGIKTGNVMFLRLNFKNLSLQREMFFKNCIPLYAKTSEGIRQNVRGYTPKRQTYTKNTTENTQRQQQAARDPMPVFDFAAAAFSSPAVSAADLDELKQSLAPQPEVVLQKPKEGPAQVVKPSISASPDQTLALPKKEAPKPKECVTDANSLIHDLTAKFSLKTSAPSPLDKLQLTEAEKRDLLHAAESCSSSSLDCTERLENAVCFVQNKINTKQPIKTLCGLLNFAIRNKPAITTVSVEEPKKPLIDAEANKRIVQTLFTLMTFARLQVRALSDRIEIKHGHGYDFVYYHEPSFVQQLICIARKEGLTEAAAKYIQELKEQGVHT